MKASALLGVDASELCFLEVCRDPKITDLRDLHELLSGGYMRADFRRALQHDAVHGSDNFGIAQLELCCFDLRLGTLRAGLVGGDRGPADGNLLRSRAAVLGQLALRLQELS